ncbi:MAG: exodeoxyribonuclease VII large subunit [Bacteroidales bacterium]|nr:exodeoxyribonuclease VII large subunit [Candidatus Liminaster caballi]
MRDAISLYELNRQVTFVVSASFGAPIWITAEIAQANVAGNGHCYMELIEKSTRNNTITARARAMIWANKWWQLSQKFEMESGQSLQAGLKVLVRVQVQMHEAYGYSLTIDDIDPTYTMGEMQRRRQEIIRRLTDEGMIDANKSIDLPTPTQRIAVISASNAAGYGDFCHQLANNERGLKFYTHLFPAILQGEQTEQSVIHALERIYSHMEHFDAVVIIRGGGSVSDLNSFDSYELALNIANFPLPVITGIGHERDTTVLDAVAHTSVKTPTAAAAMFIEMAAEELNRLEQIQYAVIDNSRGRIDRERNRLNRLSSSVRDTHLRLGQQINHLDLTLERVKMYAKQRIASEQQRIAYTKRSIEMAQPDNILRRGFSITRINGKAVKDASDVKPGMVIETQTANGRFESKVTG